MFSPIRSFTSLVCSFGIVFFYQKILMVYKICENLVQAPSFGVGFWIRWVRYPRENLKVTHIKIISEYLLFQYHLVCMRLKPSIFPMCQMITIFLNGVSLMWYQRVKIRKIYIQVSQSLRQEKCKNLLHQFLELFLVKCEV